MQCQHIMTRQISRSDAFRTIPQRKIQEALLKTLRDCDTCGQNEATLNNACNNCILINTALSRFADSNIPIGYWHLKMEDFKGNKVLLDKYNELTENLNKTYYEGTCICFAGPHGTGKQLSLETELPTPTGFIKLENLKEGDRLFDEQGNVCNVVELHPINLSPESYEIEFDDGTTIKACAEHRWLTWDRDARAEKKAKNEPIIRTTKEILDTLRVGGSQQIANHSIPCTQPLNYPPQNLPIDPYVLGIWLGDGTLIDGTIECADDDILDEIKKAGYSVNLINSSLRNKSKSNKYRVGDLILSKQKRRIGLLKYQLKELEVLNNKHIPNRYLYSSFKQRLALLQGLMDSDGSCRENGLLEFCSVKLDLADQVNQLIHSFGIKSNIRKSASFLNGVRHKDRYRICFTTRIPVFRLKRKLCRLRLEKQQLCRTTHRYIINIKPIDPQPMRCITVDSSSHLFLVTRSFIPTHNTMTTSNILKKASTRGYQCLHVTLGDIVSNAVSNTAYDKFTARRELMMVDFLVIDEFDSRHMTEGAGADLFGRQMEDIFRRRSENKLPLFMCTNSPNVIESFTGPIRQSIDSLMGFATIVPVLGKDFRKGGM
ncbi:hypothetical protein LCGC14_0427050 [marine sediment metagenome]|uniref:DOD-type homing endonuclease domain-containing protein n=1 Tax=marine sediment metagenome TaxID=412755 RepID=A0A0F9VYM6_9ZZZZ